MRKAPYPVDIHAHDVVRLRSALLHGCGAAIRKVDDVTERHELSTDSPTLVLMALRHQESQMATLRAATDPSPLP